MMSNNCLQNTVLRKVITLFCGAIVFIYSPANAGPSAGCVSQFDNSQEFNWIAFRNTCSFPIRIFFKRQDDLGSSSADLSPGGVATSGWSNREIENKGGLVFAACGRGENAYEEDGRTWWVGRGQSYSCH
jgi:hypothetical protein